MWKLTCNRVFYANTQNLDLETDTIKKTLFSITFYTEAFLIDLGYIALF